MASMRRVTTISRDGTTRRALLDLLKRRGPTEAGELAAALGVTHAAVRRHLDALVADGLVASRLQRRPVGRPVALHHLTAAGDELFPRAYAELAGEVLAGVAEQQGPDGVQRLLDRVTEPLAARVAARTAGRPLAEAVGALAAEQDEAGFMASATPLDEASALLVEHNCPVARLAAGWPQVCAAELGAFRRALGDDVSVERVKHLVAGDHTCTYLVRRRPAAG